MARQPVVSTDMVAQDQIQAFIERIERMEEEKQAISDDIKEIYAEAKGNGFDTKVLRQIIRIRKMDAAERAEQEALLEIYMQALGMAMAPRDYDEEDDTPPRRSALSVRAVPSVSEPHTAPSPQVVQADHGGESDDTALAAGHQSTAASQKRAQTATGVGAGGDNLGPSSRSSAAAKTGVPAEQATASDDQGQAPGDGRSQHNSGVRVAVVDTHSIAKISAGGEDVDAAADNAGGGDSLPAVASNVRRVVAGGAPLEQRGTIN